MLTIKDIDAQVETTNKVREQLAQSKHGNERKAEEYRARADAAAVTGDVETYKKYKQLMDDAEAMAYVCGKQLEAEQNKAVTKEQTQEAWRGYADQYGKKIAAKLKEFDKAKAEALKLYAEAVDLQDEACATRERIAGYAGVSYNPGMDGKLDADYPMEYIPCETSSAGGRYCLSMPGVGIEDKDAVYYVANDLEKRRVGSTHNAFARIEDSTTNKIYHVVRLHRASAK